MRTKLLAIGLAMAGLASAAVAAVAVWRHMGPERDAAAERLLPVPVPDASGPVAEAATGLTAGTTSLPRRRLPPPDLEPHPTGMFAALGRFDYRYRRVLPVIGLALMIGLFAWSSVAGGS